MLGEAKGRLYTPNELERTFARALFPRTTNRYGCVTLHSYHFYVEEGLPRAVRLQRLACGHVTQITEPFARTPVLTNEMTDKCRAYDPSALLGGWQEAKGRRSYPQEEEAG